MSVLEIKVRNKDGEKVVYENQFMPVRKYRDYLELQVRLTDSDLSEADKLEEQLTFITSLFPGLTVEAMYDGLEMSELNDIIARVFTKLIGGDADPKEKD